MAELALKELIMYDVLEKKSVNNSNFTNFCNNRYWILV